MFVCVYTHLLARMEVRGQVLEVFPPTAGFEGLRPSDMKGRSLSRWAAISPLLLVSIQIPMWIYKKIKLGAHSRSSLRSPCYGGLLRSPCYVGSAEIPMLHGVCWDFRATWGLLRSTCYVTWGLLRSTCYMGSIISWVFCSKMIAYILCCLLVKETGSLSCGISSVLDLADLCHRDGI